MKVSRYNDLSEARENYRRKIDEAANRARDSQFTESPGQASSYDRREKQARRYKAGDSGPFPWLDAQANRTGETLDQVADAIIARADAWESASIVIEAERVAAKGEVRSASSVRAMYESLQNLNQVIETQVTNLGV